MQSSSKSGRWRVRSRAAVALTASAGMLLAFTLPSAAAGTRTATVPAAAVPAAAGQPVMATANSQGRFLGGTVGGTSLDTIAALKAAAASYPGNTGPDSQPLDATAFNSLNLDLGNGQNLLGNNGILTLGAANQYAVTTPDGIVAPSGFGAGVSSYGASGAVTDDGAIAIDGQGAPKSNASLNLTGLLSDAGIANTALDQLGVTLGALSATASETNALAQTGDYHIAGATVTIHSPLVVDVVPTITSAVGTVSDAVKSLTGPTGLLARALSALGPVTEILNALGTQLTASVSIDANVQNAVTPLLSTPLTSPDGAVTVDLSTGTITADLVKLHDLNNLPPNTELLSGDILDTITSDVSGLITTLVSNVENTVTSTVQNATLHLNATAGTLSGLAPTGLSITYDGTLESIVNGTATPSATLKLLGVPVPLPAGDVVSALLGPLNSVLFGSTGALTTLTGTLSDQILSPLTNALVPALDQLNSVVSLVANGQQTQSGAFTETAMTVTLLPGGLSGPLAAGSAQPLASGSELAQVHLASATVGQNTLATKPGAAINLTATAGDKQVALTWTAPTSDGGDPVIGYNLYRGLKPGAENPTPINGGTLIPGLGYQDLGLANGTTYYYIVKAVNRVGESAPSNEASATPSGTACPPPFLDVPSSSPFCMDILWMKSKGITKGVTPTLYKPVRPANRAEMAAFVYRDLNRGKADPTCSVKPFNDVDIDNPFCGDIAWLKANHIANGYPGDMFHPAAPILRQEISAFMFRMNNIGDPDPSCGTTAPFSDVSVTNIFCGDITWMRDTGISYGYQGGIFKPRAQTERQAMAALVHRMVNQLK